MLQEILILKKGADSEKVEALVKIINNVDEAKVDLIGLKEGVGMIVGNSAAKAAFDRFNTFGELVNQVKQPARTRRTKEEEEKED
jgi:hypothetical protein